MSEDCLHSYDLKVAGVHLPAGDEVRLKLG
jgi:hypothetical protein